MATEITLEEFMEWMDPSLYAESQNYASNLGCEEPKASSISNAFFFGAIANTFISSPETLGAFLAGIDRDEVVRRNIREVLGHYPGE